MTHDVLLRSYKMMYDTGFAPNPYCGVLSLATCKPGIRKVAQPGEWIAGFTSKALCGDIIGGERLIFLMLVSEKIKFEEYYERYPEKRPDGHSVYGDNIYTLRNGIYVQIENCWHDKHHFKKDTSTPFVLLAKEFYYFGRDAVPVPEKYRPNIPEGKAECGCDTEGKQAQLFIDWVRNEAADGRHGLIGEPHGPQPESCSKSKCW